METRLAIISIIVENMSESKNVNALLSEYGEYIIGRMGIPYRKNNVSLISIAIDAPVETINALTGKLGMLDGVRAKSLYTKI